jgi:hypothetical protein
MSGMKERRMSIDAGVIIAAFLILTASPLHAADRINPSFVEGCASDRGSPEYGECSMYVAGFVHGYFIAEHLREDQKLCLPDGLTGEEAVDAVARKLKDSVAKNMAESYEPDYAITLLLSLAYPCRKSN